MSRLQGPPWDPSAVRNCQVPGAPPPLALTLAQFICPQNFGYTYDMRWYCVLIVLAYIIFLRVASILALRYWNFLKR